MKKNWFIFLISIFIFWNFFLPGYHVASDFPYTNRESLTSRLGLPQTWNVPGYNFGNYDVATLWSWPGDVLYGSMGLIGLDFSTIELLLGLIPILLLGFTSIYELTKYLKIPKNVAFVPIFFYLTNTYIVLLIDGGQISIGLAYAIFPLAYLESIKSLDEGIKEKIKASLVVALLGFFDPRFVYLLFLLLGLHFVFTLLSKRALNLPLEVLSWIKLGFTIVIVFVGLNFYWILPAILTKAPALPATYTNTSQVSFLSFATYKNALFLFQPEWYRNVFGKISPISPEFFLIPLLVFLAPILRRKDKNIIFWTLVSLVSIFLVKGNTPPLGNVYTWLFSHIPGFSLFRDPTKFFFLTCLSYSVLIGFTLVELTKVFKVKLTFFKNQVYLIFLLILAYLIFLVRPVWLNKMTGTLSTPTNQTQFTAVSEKINADKNFGRVLWLPSRPPLGYSSSTHPSADALNLNMLRPFEIGSVGAYDTLNFIRDAKFMGQIFNIAGIKYISYPYPDPKREELKTDNVNYYYQFVDQLKNLNWVESSLTDTPVPLIETKENQDHVFITENSFIVVGSDRIYKDLVNLPNFDLSKNAIVFLEEKPNPQIFNGLKNVKKIIVYDKGTNDLAASSIDESKLYFPSTVLNSEPNSSHWWKRDTTDFLWMRNFLNQKYNLDNQDFDYGGGYAISEGNNSLTINPKNIGNNETLLVRAAVSSRSGMIEISQNNREVGRINTLNVNLEPIERSIAGYKDIPEQIFNYGSMRFMWFEVGRLQGGQPLTIRTEGDINIVNALAFINSNEWTQYQNEAQRLLDSRKAVVWSELKNSDKESLFVSDQLPSLNYKKVSSTEYKVTVEGPNRPFVIVFSETYDPLWQISSTKGLKENSIKLYSLINGFEVPGGGVYTISFTPQKYVYPGLIVSVITLLTIIFLQIFLQKTKTSRIN